APELDHDPVALPVGLVAQRGDAIDLLLAPELADTLDHYLLVHLIGNFADDDRLAISAQRLDLHFPAHDDGAAAQRVGGANAGAAENDAAGREVGAGNDLGQLLDGQRRIVDQCDRGIDHLAEI